MRTKYTEINGSFIAGENMAMRQRNGCETHPEREAGAGDDDVSG